MERHHFYVCMILVVAVIAAVIYYTRAKTAKEGFGMLPSFQVKVDRVGKVPGKKDMFFSVPGTYQSLLAPRFANVNYGSNIRYNMPDYKYQAAPCDPLSFNKMSKENYTGLEGVLDDQEKPVNLQGGNTGVVACGVNSDTPQFMSNNPLASDYSNGNYNDLLNKAYAGAGTEITSQLPVGDMTTVNAEGVNSQPVIFDRYMFANRNSRLRSQGDMFRGDLPIIPAATGWFRPSVIPNVDLQLGAMNVMGGINNETATELAKMVNAASGGEMTAIGGVNMTNQLQGSLSAAQNDVTFTAFP